MTRVMLLALSMTCWHLAKPVFVMPPIGDRWRRADASTFESDVWWRITNDRRPGATS